MSAPAKRAPARWRRVDARAFYTTKPHWELWRGADRLATVYRCSEGHYWTSALGPIRNSLADGDGGYIKEFSAAKKAAKAYATTHEAAQP